MATICWAETTSEANDFEIFEGTYGSPEFVVIGFTVAGVKALTPVFGAAGHGDFEPRNEIGKSRLAEA
ncbi:hypothetical protein M408DRAFT_330430, partial [Serendipita vermifera MAFF 305830]